MAATIYDQLEHAVNIQSVTTSEQWQYTINDNMRSVTIYGQRQYTIRDNIWSVRIYGSEL
jgi:hypothetical protein